MMLGEITAFFGAALRKAGIVLMGFTGLVYSTSLVDQVSGREEGRKILAARAVGPALTMPEGELSRPAEPTTANPVGPARAGFRYAIGDRLRITFYEQISADAESPRRKGRSLVERAELSGEYVVQLDGHVFLPIIGPVRVADQTPVQAEAALTDMTSAAIGEPLKVSLVISDREPVYVMGTRSRAGVYKYTPGMVVAQVLALAGGDATGGDNWQQIDIAREQERIRKSMERMKRQLALIDVLVAESKGIAPKPSPRLIEFAGSEAADLLQAAKGTRELERARQELHLSSLANLLVATKADLKALHARLNQVTAIVSERTKRWDTIANRVGRGVSTENLMMQARNELVEIQSSWHEIRSAVARNEIRVLELERDRDQARLAAQIDIEQQLRNARTTVADEEIMLSTIGQLLLKIGPTFTNRPTVGEQRYVLIRRTLTGPTELAAQMMTTLEPGDVVKVIMRKPESDTDPIR